MYNNDPIILLVSATVLLFIMVIGTMTIFYNYRKRKNTLLQEQLLLKLNLRDQEIENMHKLETQRQRIYHDLHDNIGSTLAATKLQTNFLKSQVNGDMVQSEVKELEGMVDLAYEQLKEIVWYMAGEKNTIGDLADYAKEYSHSFLGKTDIALHYADELSAPQNYISAELRKDIINTLKELLHNIIKHAEASRVWVTLSQNDSTLTLRVKDDGIGLKADSAGANSNGLKTIEQRIKKHMGTVKMQTADGLETKLTFPLKPTDS